MKKRRAGSVDIAALKPLKNRVLYGTIAALLGSGSAHGQLTITPIYDSSITTLSNASAVEAAIQNAINGVEASMTTRFADNISINFQATSDPTVLAESLSATNFINYNQFLSDLQANPNKSAVQSTAIASMPTGPIAALNNATQVSLTASNLFAIGETSLAQSAISANGGTAGTIIINTDQTNASRTTNLVMGNYDMQAAANHEIDEILGIGGSGSALYQPGNNPPLTLPTNIGALDLFRYSANGTRSFTYDSSTQAYFSIDGGKTNLVYFNQLGAGGADFGDWGNPANPGNGNTPAQVQDAFGTPYDGVTFSMPNLGANEIMALEVEGYQLKNTAGFWFGGVDGRWTTIGNWATNAGGTLSTTIPGAADDVTFSVNSGAANQGNTTLGQNFTIHSLTITDTNAVTISSGVGGPFTLTISGLAGKGIDVQSGAGKLTINANLTFAGKSNTITVDNAAGAVINGVFGGSNGVIKQGLGTLTLNNNANTYTGSTTVAQGTIVLGSSGALPSTTDVVLGTASSTTTGMIDLNGNSATIDGLTLATGNTAGVGNVITNSSTTAGTLTISSTKTSSSYAGLLSGKLSLVKAGAGTTLTLAQTETYTGSTSVTGGSIQLGITGLPAAIPSGSAVSLSNGGALVLVNVVGNAISNNMSNGVTGTGGIIANSASTLTVSGVLSDGAAGKFAIIQNGSGRTILTATDTFTGGTVINAGVVEVDGSLAAGNAVSIATGGTLAGTGTINGNVTMTGNAVSNLGAGGTIVGTLGITGGKWTGVGIVDGTATSSSGTFTLSGNMTATAGLTVSGGILAGTGTLNGPLNFSSSTANTFGGTITGSGGVTVNTTSSLTLTGTDDYTGATTLNGGTLQIGNGTSGNLTKTSGVTLSGTSTLITDLATGATFAAPVNLSVAGTTLKTIQSGTNTLSGIISGSGTFNQNGTGTTILTGVNTYTGATKVTTGTLQLGNGTSGTLASGTTVTVANNAVFAVDMADGASINVPIVLNGTNAVLKGISAGKNTLASVISGTGVVDQNGTGTTVLDATETYTGATNVNTGTLQIDGSTVAASTVNISTAGTLSGAGTAGGKVNLTGNGTINLQTGGNLAQTLTITGGNWSGLGSVTGPVTASGTGNAFVLTGNLTAKSGLAVTGGAFAGTGTLTGSLNYTSATSSTFNGAIADGTSTSTVTVAGGTASTLTLGGTSTYTGATNVTSGTLQVGNGSGGNLAAGTTVNVNAGATLALNMADGATFAPTSIVLNGATATFKGNETGVNTNKVTGVISGTGSFVQSGTGITILTGNEQYTGATNLNNGLLDLEGSLAAGSTVNIGTAGALSGGGKVNGKVNLTGNGLIDFGSNGEIGNTLTVTGGHWLGAGQVDLAVTSSSGTFDIASGSNLTALSGVNITGGSITGVGTITGNVNYTSSTSSSFGGVIAGANSALTMNKTGSTFTLVNTNTYGGATTVSGGTLQVGDGFTGGNLSNSSSVTVSGTGVLGIDLINNDIFSPAIFLNGATTSVKGLEQQSITNTISGVISGTGSFTQAGAGTTILNKTETYTGPTNITLGTVEVDGSLAAGSTVNIANGGFLTGSGTIGGKVTVTGLGTINLNNGTINGAVSATGGVWAGPGTVNGLVTVSSGQFLIEDDLIATTSGVAVTGGTIANTINGKITGSLNYTSGSNSIFSGVIAGVGATVTMNKTGSTLTLAGADTYGGATVVNGGTLVIGDGANGNLLNSSGVTVTGTGVFALNLGVNSDTFAPTIFLNGTGAQLKGLTGDNNVTGVISGTGSVVISGGKLVLKSAETYTGPTNVSNGGYLEVDGSIASGSVVNIGTTAQLAGNGTVNGKVNLSGGGDIDFTSPGSIGGTLTVTGGSWSGNGSVGSLVTVSSGNFDVGGSLTATTAGVAVTGGTLSGTGTITGSVNYTSSASSTFGGVIAGGASSVTVNKTGSTLILTGANTYGGTTNIGAGTLQVGDGMTAGATLGSGAITVSGTGALAIDLASGETFSQNVAVSATGATVKAIAPGTNTITGIISGVGGFAQNGAGTTILKGAQAYSGATSVNTGTLQVDGSTAAASTVNVAAAGTLSGTGTIAGTVNVLSGGTISAGDPSGPGTLTVGKLVLNAGSNSNFRLDTAGTIGGGVNDLINVTGNLTLGGTLNITQLTNFGTGIYTLYTYGGTLTGGGFSAINGVGGFASSIVTGVAGKVELVISGSATTQYWDGTGTTGNGAIGGGGGTWNTATTNWTDNAGATNSAWLGGTAVFNAPGGTVMLGAPINAQGLIFGSTGYVINGTTTNVLNLVGTATSAPTISVSNAGTTATIGAPITGKAGLAANGHGTLVLTSSANTYTGGTAVTSGTLQIGTTSAPGSLGSGTIAIGSGGTLSVFNIKGNAITNNVTNGLGAMGTLQINSTLTNTISGALTDGSTGTLGLTQSGTGTTILVGNNNTYSGNTTVSKGVLQVGTTGTTGVAGTVGSSSAINVGTGGTFTIARLHTNTFANAIDNSLGGVGTVVINSVDSNTLSGTISNSNGTLNLTQSGTGTTILTGTDTYTGTTTVSAGTLQIGDGTSGSLTGSTGLVTVSGTGSLALDMANSGTFARNITLSAATATVKGLESTATANTVSGVIGGTGGFTQVGLGTTIFTGLNTYTGATMVTHGTLEVDGSTAAGSTVTVGSVSTGGTLTGSGTVKGKVNLTGQGIINLNGGTIANTLTVTNGGAWNGTGTVTGLVTDSSGTFTIGNNANLSASAGVAITGGTLAGSGTITGNVNYTSSLASVFPGVIAGSTSSLTVNKTGTTLTLTGQNTYGGPTTISAGTLQLGDAFTPNTSLGSGNVTVSGTGTLALELADTSTFSKNVTLSAAGATFEGFTYTGMTNTISGIISGSGSFKQAGLGKTILQGTQLYTGPTNITAGTLEVDGSLAPGSTVNVGTAGTLTGTGSIGGKATLTGNGTIDFSLALPSASIASTLAVTGGNWTGFGAVNGLVTSSSGTFNITGSLTAPAGLAVTGGTITGSGGALVGSLNYTSSSSSTFGAIISNGAAPSTVTMNKAGSTLTLTGDSTYSGATNVTTGTLQVGDGTTANTALGTSVVTVATAGTLTTNLASGGSLANNVTNNGKVITTGSANYTLGGVISGTGTVTKTGTNNVTLTGANTYKGGTVISAGALLVSNTSGSGTGTGAVTVNSGAALGGSGTISGATTLNSGGTVAPGFGLATAGTTLHGSSLLWNGGSTMTFNIGSSSDELALTGALTKGTLGDYIIDINNDTIVNGTYTLITFASTSFAQSNFTLELPTGYTGLLVETATSLVLQNLTAPSMQAPAHSEVASTPATTDPSSLFSTDATSGSGTDSGVTLTPTPEPGSAMLLAFGGCTILGWRRRRRAA